MTSGHLNNFAHFDVNILCTIYRQQLFDSGITSSHNKAITLLLDLPERVLPQDLVIAENESVRKVVSVLVFLCDEVYQLRDIAEGRYVRFLSSYTSSQLKPYIFAIQIDFIFLC